MADIITKDLVILGGGPAGLSAAIYAQRALLDTVVLEKEAIGGQVILTSEIDNYPGVPHTDGFSLTDAMQKQAQDLGAEIVMQNVLSIDKVDDEFIIKTTKYEYHSKALIVAGGATPRHAGFDGEETFGGKGVSYCATCDGMFYRGKTVYVIGGGNSAAEEAQFLTKFADKVYLVVRKDHLRAQAIVAKQIQENDKIEVLFQTNITKVEGDGLLEKVTLKNTATDEERTVEYEKGQFGVFVFVGRVPASEILGDLVDKDPAGYIVTDAYMKTKTEGLFAAGDVRTTPLRQIITAAADGAIAATSASAYLGRPLE